MDSTLVRRERRLSKIFSRLLGSFAVFFWVIPLGAIAAAKVFKISDGWVVFCLIGGTVVGFLILALNTVVGNRRDAAREAVVFEAAKQDLRPYCLLLRSFSDVDLGYGLPFTQLGDKGERQFEGPVHFRALAGSLGQTGRLLVLCREPVDDSRLRSGDFEHIGLRAPDENWIDLFREIALGARAIVVVPGDPAAHRGGLHDT